MEGADLYLSTARRANDRTLDAVRTMQARSRANVAGATVAITVVLAVASRNDADGPTVGLALFALAAFIGVALVALRIERPFERAGEPNLAELREHLESGQWTADQLAYWTAREYEQRCLPINQRWMTYAARRLGWELRLLVAQGTALTLLLTWQLW